MQETVSFKTSSNSRRYFRGFSLVFQEQQKILWSFCCIITTAEDALGVLLHSNSSRRYFEGSPVFY
jgi:hypothetical protein